MLTLTRMVWAKTPVFQTRNPEDRMLLGEALFRQVEAMRGRTVQIPPPARLGQLKAYLFVGAEERASRRREQLELTQLTVQFQLASRILEGLKLSLPEADREMLLYLLHQVHRIENPAAVRPHTQTGNRLEEDFQRLTEAGLFKAPLRVQASGD